MTATDQMRAMLDQLMGTTRNGESTRYTLKFSDTKVCKSFLLGCCPHEILASTRMDLGECPKIHDLALRADYENASKHKDFYYDIEAMEHLQAFINDCDRRTDAAKKRLAETQEELTAEVAEKANAVHALAEDIAKKLTKAEALGQEGEVEESVKLMNEIDELRAKKAKAEHEYRSSMPASTYQQQKLRVCEVCSAYLGIHDNDIRLADHFGGKLHLGFMAIRDKLIELEKTAGPRKSELRKGSSYRDRDEDKYKSRYYVGGRELDRRSRVHRSRSRERKPSKSSSGGGGGERNDRGSDRGDRDRGDRGSDRGDRGSDRGDRGSERGDRGSERGDRGSERGERGSERGERGSERGDRGSERGDRGSDRGGDRGADRGSDRGGVDRGGVDRGGERGVGDRGGGDRGGDRGSSSSAAGQNSRRQVSRSRSRSPGNIRNSRHQSRRRSYSRERERY